MKNMNRLLPLLLAFPALALLPPAGAQSTTNIWKGGSGDWTNAAKWTSVAAPTSTDALFITNTASSYTVSIDAGTTGSSLTNFSLSLGGSAIGPTQTLSVASAPATWRVTTTNVINQRGVLILDNTTLSVGTNLAVRGQLIARNNSSVVITEPLANNSFQIGGNGVGANALASFSGGSLIVTNGANGATLIVGNNTIGAGSLYVTNTLVRVSTYSQGTRVAYIDNSGISSTSLLRTVTVSVSGDTSASLILAGGIFDGTSGRVAISGQNASITNRGAVWNMTSGDMSIGHAAGSLGYLVQDGGTTRTVKAGVDTGEFRVGSAAGGTGTLTVAKGLLTANGDGTSFGALTVGANATGVGTFNQYGGRVVITNGTLNANVRVGDFGKAFFNFTNGTLLADRVNLGTNLQQFIVATSALFEVRGTMGFSNVAPLSVSNAFDFDGTLKFSPTILTATQRLVLAGLNLGASTLGFSNNFSLGTLDLGGFGTSNRLQLFAGNSMASTALYVEVLSPIATNALISSFNVFYLASQNPILASGGAGGTYLLSGGGSLLPIMIPEPDALALVVFGALLLARRMRRARSE